MAYPTPREAMARSIGKFEGLFQNYSWDPGNYVMMPDGTKRLVGTMRGVTAAAYAAFLGEPPAAMTAKRLTEEVTEDVASKIAEVSFYKALRLDRLPWGPATEVILDTSWGSWAASIQMMQRLAGTRADGLIGPQTIHAYTVWLNKVGWEGACRQLRAARMAYYKALAIQDPVKYGPPQPGWKRRADWFLPGTGWWETWLEDGKLPALPMIGESPVPTSQVLPMLDAGPLKPMHKSNTLRAFMATLLGGVGLATDPQTIQDGVTAALPQAASAVSLPGVTKWVFLAFIIGGVLFGAYRIAHDRWASGRVGAL